MTNMRIIQLFIFTLFCQGVFSQGREVSVREKPASDNSIKLNWQGVMREKISDEITFEYLYFEGANIDAESNFLPKYYSLINLSANPEKIETIISNEHFEELLPDELAVIKNPGSISEKINVQSKVVFYRKSPQLLITFIPIRKNNSTGKYEKLISFQLKTKISAAKKKISSGRTYASSSVLSAGTWYKIAVTSEGIYKISHSILKSMGMDVAGINPQNIRIYGNGGAMLPIQNSQYRPDDLLENAIYVEGENDGKFDAGDFVLFYGQSTNVWSLDPASNTFRHKQNYYSDTSFYFITTDLGNGKRVSVQPSLSNAAVTVNSFNDYDFYEKDLINPIRSGREWLGETFSIVTEYDFVFSFPYLSSESPVSLRTVVAGRTSPQNVQSFFNVRLNGQDAGTITVDGISGVYTDSFASKKEGFSTITTTNATLKVYLSFSKGNSGAQGFLDFIEVNARRKLIFPGDQLMFRDINSVGKGTAKFQLGNTNSDIVIWNVTDILNVKRQDATLSGSSLEFNASADLLNEYVAFDISAPLLTPKFREKITNQNLHNIFIADLIIVTNPLFEKEAEDLADFHSEKDKLRTIVATTEEIFNEFSSGKQDVTAIKDFVKMFFDRAGSDSSALPKYLLLFGDGSYDPKNRISGNTNYVTTYQSSNSLSPTLSYVADDYFGLLNDDEGDDTEEPVDIGIGRLIVKNTTEAQQALTKIKHYYDASTMRPWRNYLTFIGDDEDGNIHMIQANSVASTVETKYKRYNIDKILLDAYKQQVNTGGQRYPDVNAAIDNRLDIGTLMWTWVGHGGELGLAHERIVQISQINGWKNFDNLPLFITATCEFTRFDDPQRTSAGEFVFLNPNGGGIALLSTTRLVYSSPNFDLLNAFTYAAFETIDQGNPRLGDLVRVTKNNGPFGVNSRAFALVGDPALRLAYPLYDVITTEKPDTMRALSKVTVKGYVANKGQKMTDFNGVIYPMIFDKPATINTLNNDGVGVFTFKSQKNVLFKGKASVKNGEFEYSFIVPKDISYTYGNGKISHYGQNGVTDASGQYGNFIVGGSDSLAASDNTGPRIQLFLNDEKFVFGGITDENPKLFAKLFDENGINTTGNGIGHDIVAVLDEKTTSAIVLNDHYESDMDSYQSGTVRYPLKDLTEGKHTLRLKALDVYNNSSEANTEFIVAKSAELALEHVLNYPNPFTSNTAFYFEHNQPGQNLDIQIQIFTVSGKLVKSIDSFVYADSFRAGPIYWNGLDDFGDKIGKGVYVYKLKVIAPSGTMVNKYEKLVILN